VGALEGDKAEEMKIATWNVNGINAHHKHVLDWLTANSPDVLALQETQCHAARFPKGAFQQLGYEVAAVGDGGRSGVALLSRHPIGDVVDGIPGAIGPFTEPRLLRATVQGVRIVVGYAPNGKKVSAPNHQFKLGWLHLLRAVVEDEIDTYTDVVVVADLNIAPTDLDVWDAHHYRSRNLTSPVERNAFHELINIGLTDVVRASHPGQQLSSWWNRRGDFFDSDRGWRLDHILATQRLAATIQSTHIDRLARSIPGTSDHAPITATFRAQ
jgi:exodeoxyribonuclease III